MRRLGCVAAMVVSALLIGGPTLFPVPPKLIWNASASVPVGLYAIAPDAPLTLTDLAVIRAPEPLAGFMAERGYLPRHVPLIKRVAALSGQHVCRIGHTILIDGIAMAEARDRDRFGRPLPAWQGCRVVGSGELFLLNAPVRDSLDGRYFGPIHVSAVIGRAIPLYTDDADDGRFAWAAPMR